ncbi:MAG: phosphodiester glycosidase family protein [Parachlamydiales bacterium]
MFRFLILFSLPLSAFQYAHFTLEGPQSVHLLLLEGGERLSIAVAEGRAPVSALAAEALAGVNGGFFKEDGSPAGGLKREGEWIALPHLPRGAVGWEGERIHFAPGLPTEIWSLYPNVLQGTPLLIREGQPIWDYTGEAITNPTFISGRHARTAIGELWDGTRLLLVVDGSQPGFSEGLTLKELTLLLLDLGCRNALNLDGGSSSTLVIRGQVVNQPCTLFSWEKPVGDALLVR